MQMQAEDVLAEELHAPCQQQSQQARQHAEADDEGLVEPAPQQPGRHEDQESQ